MMTAYYNEIDKNACLWLEELIRMGQIAPGHVDSRSIVDVSPDELRSYDQLHFFAGVGVWSYALRQAGWADDRPIVTGSCPCQPWSSAGKRANHKDPRDLWWAMFWHICQLRPTTVIGEQVASKDGLRWWDGVSNELETANYAATAFDLSAAGYAPHIRQRLYWVANSQSAEQEPSTSPRQRRSGVTGSGDDDWMGNADDPKRGPDFINEVVVDGQKEKRHQSTNQLIKSGKAISCGVGNTNESTSRGHGRKLPETQTKTYRQWHSDGESSNRFSYASPELQWVECLDGKNRPFESSILPVAYGIAPDVVRGGDTCIQTEKTLEAQGMRIKGYGNAIVAPMATDFIRCVMEVL